MSDPKPPPQGADVGDFLREPPPQPDQPARANDGAVRPNAGRVPARMSFVTLAVVDMPAMTRFYRQFGWPEAKVSDEHFVAFQTSGAVLGLFPATNYEEEFGSPPPAGAFKGFVLAINLEDAGRVDGAYETMKGFDRIRIMGEPKDLSFGGRGFEFLDPEGNAWEVVWAEDTSFDERGALIFP
jgi:catechol 2,3-dioxygenase-like lactoylglutathione lyase family enzyme